MEFHETLKAAIYSEPDRPMMDYKGRFYTAGDMAALSKRVAALLTEAGVERENSIGIILRNRPLHACAVLAVVAEGLALTTVYSMQSPEMIAKEIAESRFAVVIADEQDWTEPVIEAARAAGAAGLVLRLDAPEAIVPLPGLERKGRGPFRRIEGEPGLEILSSGTTGKPKRVLFPFRMLVRTVESVLFQFSGKAVSPHVEALPFTGIGGMSALLANPIIGRYSALLEKFNVPEWVEAVKRLRPTHASGPPTVPRMILDAGVPPEDLASIRYWFGGGAAFTPELQDEFETTYGIKVIWAYGATEFCGTLMSWTPDLHAVYRDIKRGAVGKPLPGIQVRVVDVETGEPLPAGREGYLQALVPDVSADWIHTTDLMMIDEDGFAYHRGRGDGAILRGGFKVLPEKIVDALLTHPSVLDAGAVGMPDRRLGQVPVAAVELKSGEPRPSEQELLDHCRRLLVIPHLPTRIVILDSLPRTTSLKVEVGALRRRLEAELEDQRATGTSLAG